MSSELDDALQRRVDDLLTQRWNYCRQQLIESLVSGELQTGSRLSSSEEQWGDASTLNR